MRLLVVAPYPPSPPFAGGRRRILEQLHAFGRTNDVDLACLTYGAADDAWLAQAKLPRVRMFGVRCVSRQHAELPTERPRLVETFWSNELMERITSLADNTAYDWVIAEHCYAGAYVDSLSARKMLTEHNVEYLLFEQLASHDGDLNDTFLLAGRPGEMFRNALQQLPVLRDFEHKLWARMDLCVTVSEAERQIVSTTVTELELHVAPNCAGLPVRTAPLKPGPPSICFVGALNYFPNVDAVAYFVQSVLPMVRQQWPSIEVFVSGRDPEPQLLEFCRKAGVHAIANPVSIDEAMTSGSVMVCPLRFGAGTRIKVLDAIAIGVPVVATALAVEGLDAKAGQGFLVADTPREFSAVLSELLGSQALRDRVAEAGREFLRTKDLTWSRVFVELAGRLEGSL